MSGAINRPGTESAGRAAMAAIRGQAAAESVLRRVAAGGAPPSALADALVWFQGERHAVQGFCRAVQKALESRTLQQPQK